MPKKIQEYGKAHIINVPLPAHGETYTVISHESVINMSTLALTNAGFTVVEEEYRANADGQIAQGIYKLNFNSDPELSMMFAWTNSYNKQVRFKCGVGAYVNKTGTVMVCGDMGSWARKHTGTADTETQETIDEQVANAHMYYNQLCSDKASMELITMNKRRQSQMLGILFAEYQILTTEQASMIRDHMKRPVHVFSNADSLWAFYNYVTTALQQSHPKTWMEDQRILHMFISEVNKFAPTSTPAPLYVATPIVTESEFVDPNQISILDQIADLEADQIDEDVRYAAAELPDNQVVQNGSDFDIDLHQSEEIILDAIEAKEDVLTEDELAHQLYGVDNDIEVSIPSVDLDAEEDEDWNQLEAEGTITPIVQYTDPAGNTFEAPVVIDDFAKEDNFDLDFIDTEEEIGDAPDFF
jgi:hypothetical protein